MSVDPDGGFCCGAVETIIDGVAYMMLPEVVTTASRIALTALPIITSVISYNMSGGPIFKGADDGLYSMAPSMTGNRYYQAIDNQWQLIRDDGLMQEQYARDISTAHDNIASGFVTLTEIALGGYGGLLRGVPARQVVSTGLRGSAAQVAAKGGAGALDGSFSVLNWRGYPAGGIKPTGPFRILEGAEYNSARSLANSTNAAMRKANPGMFRGLQIHEIHPVRFGGSPTDLSNKIFLTPAQHAQYTNFWNSLMRSTR